jgi:hypothetical protein
MLTTAPHFSATFKYARRKPKRLEAPNIHKSIVMSLLNEDHRIAMDMGAVPKGRNFSHRESFLPLLGASSMLGRAPISMPSLGR